MVRAGATGHRIAIAVIVPKAEIAAEE